MRVVDERAEVMAPVLSFLVVAEAASWPSWAEELRRSGYAAVDRTATVAAAVDAVRRGRPDVVLAELATVERLQQLTAAVRRLKGTKVVVVSRLPAEVAMLTCMAAGVRAFLRDPVEPDELERALAWVIAGHVVVDPRSTGWLVDLALYGHRARPDSGLTLRQSQVIVLVRGGLTNREIARVLGLSVDTVKTHLRDAMKRLGAGDRWAATVLADRLRDEEGRP